MDITRCPDCGSFDVIERPGMMLSLYNCKNCHCEFRQCEANQVAEFYADCDKLKKEIAEKNEKIEEAKKEIDELVSQKKLLEKQMEALRWNIVDIRRQWKMKFWNNLQKDYYIMKLRNKPI